MATLGLPGTVGLRAGEPEAWERAAGGVGEAAALSKLKVGVWGECGLVLPIEVSGEVGGAEPGDPTGVVVATVVVWTERPCGFDGSIESSDWPCHSKRCVDVSTCVCMSVHVDA